MKLSEIVKAYEAIESVKDSITNFDAGYALARLQNELSIAYNEYTRQRAALIEKYGKEPDQSKPEEKGIRGKFIPPDSPELEKFYGEFSPMMESNVDVKFTKIIPEKLSGQNISMKIVSALYQFFKE